MCRYTPSWTWLVFTFSYKEKRKWVNKYAQRYLGFKPFTVKKGKRFKKGGGLNKKGEEALRKLILEMENR